jgi:uncharacterized membrane protein
VEITYEEKIIIALAVLLGIVVCLLGCALCFIQSLLKQKEGGGVIIKTPVPPSPVIAPPSVD